MESANLKCRTCYESNTSFHQLMNEADPESFGGKTFAELLWALAKIDVTGSSVKAVPQQICVDCARKLRSAYSFVLQARQVNEQLLGAANEHGLLNEFTGKQQPLDCLIETPIDMPPAQDCRQIKMEIDFGEESYCDSVSATPLLLENFQDQGIDVANDIQSKEISEQLRANIDESVKEGGPQNFTQNNWELNEEPDFDAQHFESKHSDSDSTDDQPLLFRQAKHTDSKERPYKCDVCAKTFVWKKDMRRHLRIHYTTDFGLGCDYCGRQFLRKDKLREHMKIHLNQLGNAFEDNLNTPKQERPIDAFDVDIKTEIKTPTRRLRPGMKLAEWNFADRLYTEENFSLIRCKLCSNSFKSTSVLRNHMLQHIEPNTILLESSSDVVRELFPSIQSLDEIKRQICADIAKKRLAKYYAVVNAYGYEMCLSDSDSDTADGALVRGKYGCELCGQMFSRKYQVFAHAKEKHATDPMPHKCSVCKLEFLCEQMYKTHTRTQCRSREKKYQCLKCPGKFMWLENLEGHKCSNRFNTPEYKATVQRNRQLLKCNICNKTFVWMKNLKHHLETHDAKGSLNECPICFQRFLKSDNLRQHMREAHEQLQRRIECRLCGEQFEKLHSLRNHLPQHADGSTGVKMSEGLFYKTYYPDGWLGREDEVINAVNFDFVNNRLSRFYSAIDEGGNEMDLNDSESDVDGSVNDDNRVMYVCDICSETFNRRKHVLLHQNTEHNNIKPLPHSCPECHKEFVCRPLLDRHMIRDCLNGDKQFNCKKCSARFVWEKNLQLHLQLNHIDPEQQISRQLSNKLQCDQCDKVFVWPKDLIRHKRVHMPDDEKFECPYCDRKFNRKDNMHSHLRTHKKEAAAAATRKNMQKPIKGVDVNLCKPNGCKCIQCMICLSKHSKISDLRTHLRTHQYVVNFAQRSESISEISAFLYPDEPIMKEESLVKRITEDVTSQRLEHFYSITNELGYELSLSTSETESESEAEGELDPSDHMNRRRYTCELCDVSFSRKFKLFEHQMNKHEWVEAPHLCVNCDQRFVSDEMLRLHHRNQCHNTQKRFVCRKCTYKFMWKENYKMHLRTVHAEADDSKKVDVPQRTFGCLECNCSFQMQRDLTRHMITHRVDADILKCLWCSRKFYQKENLYMHLKRHGIMPEDYNAAACFVTASNSPNGSKHILCKVCNVQVDSIAALRLHVLGESLSALTPHHHYDSPLNYSITNKLGFELHIDDSETENEEGGTSNGPMKYTCEICNLSCRRKFEMAQHQLSMHRYEQIPLKCEKCIFKTVSKDILEHHVRSQCKNVEKQFECAVCSYKFMWKENLDNHLLLLHPNEEKTTQEGQSIKAKADKVFECEKCNSKYNRKDRLKTHMKKMHSGNNDSDLDKKDNSHIDPVTGEKASKVPSEKLFLCALCGRAVTSSSNLMIHMRRHTGEKPFKCDFCDMAFPRSSDLQCHRRTHTGEKPHKCTVCDKAFSRSYKLQTHMRTHSGERPYKCTYCEKSFTQSNDLNLHIRRHTGERPYVCNVCGERFIQGTALKNHRTMWEHFE